MSTQRYTGNTRQPAAASTSFALQNAPRTFSPDNTRDCPQMFADKWQADGE